MDIDKELASLRARLDALEAQREAELTVDDLLEIVDDVFRKERWKLRPFYIVGGSQPA